MLESGWGEVLAWLQSCSELTALWCLGLAAIFIIASFGIPRVLLNLAVGATFGPWALLIIQPSATIGAVLAFLVSRHLLADRIRRHAEAKPLLEAIVASIDWKVVALIRLASPIPSPVATYLFGVSKVGVWPFAVATFIFTLPQNVLQIYLGATGRAMLLEDTASPLQLSLMLAGLACLAGGVLVVARRARLALQSMATARAAR